MPPDVLLDRYDRERAFHDARFSDEVRVRTAKYYAVDRGHQWYDAHLTAVPRGARVLEYGCGTGSAALALASRGCDVLGIDISPVGVETARAEASRLGSEARFEVMNAEALDLPDGSVDVVCGSGILHHLDLDRALTEVARVLRPGGSAVFREPLGTNPLINLYRRCTPWLRTPDEHPLTDDDLADLARRFGHVELQRCNLLSLLAAPLAGRRWARPVVRLLQRVDDLVLRLPVLRHLAWVVVIRVEDPR